MAVEPVVSDKLIPIITDIGKQALFKKDIDGLKIQISHIALGSGRYTPTTEQTTLEKEELREVFLSSNIDKENYQVTLNSIFRDKTKEFWVTEVGFFLEDGTLFAVWSHEETALSYKSKFAEPIFAFNLKLVDVNIDAIEIIDNGVDLNLNYAEEFLDLGGSIVRLTGTVYSINEKLRVLKEERENDLTSLQNKDIELSKEIQKQRDDLLLPILANANGVISIQNILIDKKLN